MSIKRTGLLLSFTLLLVAGCASTGDFLSDSRTTTRVKTAIYNEPELKVMAIHVATEEGVVTLSGAVKTRAERAKAVQVARKVEGVKQVKNDLTVQ
ncbi:MAG TPA: BON domain-containing protein [Burkholderiales bacterium]|nr:BON domain-containing protein [Burkholderiales bacterium]